MVKAPSSHGLDRKYKPWRRGKSAKTNSTTKSGASLKQKLRGLRRLHEKKSKEQDTKNNGGENSNADLLKELQSKINALQQQIASMNESEKERANAKKSHKMRFVERQKTTRLYKQLQQQQPEQKKSKNIENELFKLALDQVYVAHYPHEHSSYLSLYNNNERRSNMNRRMLYKMAKQRQRVLERISTVERVNWISAEQYDRVIGVVTAKQKPCWSTELERITFGITVTDGASGFSNTPGASERTDSRFAAISERAQKLVEEQEQIAKELDQEEETEEAEKSTGTKRKQRDSEEEEDDDDESSSSEDDADPLVKPFTDAYEKQRSVKTSEKDNERVRNNNDESSDGSMSSQSDEEEKEDGDMGNAKNARTANDNNSDDDSTTSSSSSSSNNSSSSSEDNNESAPPVKNEPITNTAMQPRIITAAQDEFLVAADDDDDGDVFANAKRHHPSMEDAKGDKSKGWATQRQFPGQFRKKQRRR